MFSIRSKVQNATPLPSSYNNNNTRRKTSQIKKKRKKRKASEIANGSNDYPSAKRFMKRISIIGVDKLQSKEIIQNKDFLLCEYHSNFPPFLVDQLQSIPKNKLKTNVSMKSCSNQWIIAKVRLENNKTYLIYWNTIENNHNNQCSPSKCFMIENKCIVYDSEEFNENKRETIDICSDIAHIHLLYPCASSYSTLKPHKSGNDTKTDTRNPFLPYASDIPLFPSSVSRSMSCISGLLFLSSDHTSLYVIPNEHTTTINYENESEGNYEYGINKNIVYKVALLTEKTKYNESITNLQILPQPRVGTIHTINTYKILMSTSHGRLFFITIVINPNASSQNENVYFGGIDHSDLSSKVIVKDQELLFAFSDSNTRTPSTNNPNIGWLGYVVSKIKINNNHSNRALESEGSTNAQVISDLCFGLNAKCTKVMGYVLRRQSIDCIEFSEKDYNLLWTFSLKQALSPNEEALSISLLGQGISVLSGFIDQQYGHAINVSLFKIKNKSLLFYAKSLIQLPSHIHIRDLRQMRYQTFWSYYGRSTSTSTSTSDKSDKSDESDSDKLSSLPELPFALDRQASMAEFIEQKHDTRRNMICNQHKLVAPFGLIWNRNKECISLFPLLRKDSTDEIYNRILNDYHSLYSMRLDNECGPDSDHFKNGFVSTFEGLHCVSFGGGHMYVNGDGGYGYFMNDKYQIMRIKYSLNSAMACIHSDIEYYQKREKEKEKKKIKTMIQLAFSEFRNGGQARAVRLAQKLINENITVLSKQICGISESILNLKLFDTFCQSQTKQTHGFDTNKMRLGMNQIYIKLQTYEDYTHFLQQMPSANDRSLWYFVHNQQKCDIVRHREYLEIAHGLFNYFTNNENSHDHYHCESNINISDSECDSLSNYNFESDSNHAMYRQKYFCLKKAFIPKLLQCVIVKRGDIEYMNTFGNDENDTFFMRIAKIKQILTELPAFLSVFLSKEEKEEKSEKTVLIDQVISIRISFEIFECIINSCNRYRSSHKDLMHKIFKKCKQTLWNYTNEIRTISIQLCRTIIPYLHRINPSVIDTNNNYYNYILIKEKNQIYRNLNEISRMILESYKQELHLLQNQFQDSTAYHALNKNFVRDRSYLISNLYDLFPINASKQSLDRWKTDSIKDSVNTIAFDYGDCQYLIKMCDAKHINDSNICIQRFVNNLKRYQYAFMERYFEYHKANINAFLCINIRKSEIWKSEMNELLNECISKYISVNTVNEYAWIHNLSIGKYAHTATQLFDITKDTNRISFSEETIYLSMAKLSLFVSGTSHGKTMDCIESDLRWIDAKQLLKSYSMQKYPNEKALQRMSKLNIVKNLIKEECSKKHENGINCQHMQQILSLIHSLHSESHSLMSFFIENVIDCNSQEWETLDLMIEPKNRVTDIRFEDINRTLIYEMTKYFFDAKNQAKFLQNQNENKNESDTNICEEEILCELWSSGINSLIKNKSNSKISNWGYYAVRALAFAQSPMIT